jgi:hypothetical protein
MMCFRRFIPLCCIPPCLGMRMRSSMSDPKRRTCDNAWTVSHLVRW